MRTRRRLLVLVTVAVVLAPPTAWPAEDDDVEQTHTEALLAEGRVAEADRLVNAAVAHRDRIEAQMLVVLDRYERANRRLAEVSVGLERIETAIDATTAAMYLARSRLSRLTVGDYMRAVAASGVYLLAATEAADTVVIGETLGLLSARTLEEMHSLDGTERLWERLAAERAIELDEVRTLAQDIEAQTAELAELFRVASIDVAIAEGKVRIAAAELAATEDRLVSTTRPPATTIPRTTTTTRPRTTTTTVPRTTTTTTVPPSSTTLPPQTTTESSLVTTTSSSTTTTTSPPAGPGLGPFPADVERWRPVVSVHFPTERVDQALYVIDCESNGDPNSVNPYTGAAGLFQFLPGTWTVASAGAGVAGSSVFDPEANITAAAWLVAYSAATAHPKGPWGHWSCRPPT